MSEQSDNTKYTLKEVYENLWRCRNIEISNLWQRAVMLGVFMIALGAGYGGLWSGSNGLFSKHWILFNCSGMFISALGIVFSCLWIWMMKGSKAWQEEYEAAISAFVTNEETPSVVGWGNVFDDAAKLIAGFNHHKIQGYNAEAPECDYSVFSTNAGGYSPSKIAIMIGQVQFVTWFMLLVIHLVCVCFRKIEICDFLKSNICFIAPIACVVFVFVVYEFVHNEVKSSYFY